MKNKFWGVILILVVLVGGFLLYSNYIVEEEPPISEEVAEMDEEVAEISNDEIRVAFGADPESLDPFYAQSSPAAMVMVHMMETLFEMKPNGDIVPLLAEDYDVSEDGLTYDLYLREDVEFHDGTPFNAEAVKFNLDRLIEGGAVYSFLINKITSIEVVDEYTVRLQTDEPFAPILAHLSHDFISMISPAAVEE